jgi:predicted permease
MAANRFDRLLSIYPRPFREQYEAELRAFLTDDWERSRRRGGTLWAVRFWMRACADTAVSSVRVRMRGASGYGMLDRSGGRGGARRRLADDAVRDLMQAGRGFRRHPGFHALTMVTVGLGVAATTAAFSVLDGVVRRPLPYPDAGRLVQLSSAMRHNPDGTNPLSHPVVLSLRERSRFLESVVAVEARDRVLLGEGEPRRLSVAAGSEGVFEMLGARAAVGRLFIAADHAAGRSRVAVLSLDLWVTRYGGSRDVLGRTVMLDDELHEIVGVLSRDFVAPEAVAGSPSLWTALVLDPAATGSFGATAIGRLSAGSSGAVAESEASDLMRQAGEGDTRWPIIGARVTDLRTATVGAVGTTLWLFLGAVLLLLAIACTNVANLMLARGLDRVGDVRIRRALGASRGRLVRQMLVESLVIALAGGVAGVLLAHALVSGLVAWAPGGIPRLAEVSVDGRALLFALVVSCVTGILFGLAPAWTAVRQPCEVALSGGRTTTAKGTSRLRGTLVVVEVAMALVLVLASGLLMNSFVRMRTVDPGFEADGLVAMRIDLRAGYGDRATWLPFWNELLERTAALPGVQTAALSAFTPFLDFPMIQAPESLRMRVCSSRAFRCRRAGTAHWAFACWRAGRSTAANGPTVPESS